jgi:hypothetical protein
VLEVALVVNVLVYVYVDVVRIPDVDRVALRGDGDSSVRA